MLRKPEGNEAFLAYQAGSLQGVLGGGNFSSSPNAMQLPQQSRKFFELAQHHGSSQEGQNRSQGGDQQVLNPVHQAYLQYQAAQQKSALAMQSQQQAKMGMLGSPLGKDQDMRMGNLKMQELISMQAANQAQASSSKNSEHFARGEKQMEQRQPPLCDQRSESKPSVQSTSIGQLMPGNITRPMQVPQAQQTVQNMANNQLAMAAQLQLVQAFALEHNIDLSQAGSANLMAQLIPLIQSKMAGQLKANESNMGAQPLPVPASKQQVTSPPVASENSPHANSSSDVSGQSGTAKAKQTVSPVPFGSASNAGIVSTTNNMTFQQFAAHGRENQVPPRQSVVSGNGMSLMQPSPSSANITQGVDHSLNAKNSLSNTENMQLQMQHTRQLNQSSPQATVATSDRASGVQIQSQGGPTVYASQQRFGFTKQQLHVLKAQILAFRRLKVFNISQFLHVIF